MSSNVGLTTPRGTGTSGYVQRNLSLLKPRSTGAGQPYTLDRPPQTRQPDQAILTHARLRDIEIKVLELRDELEEQEVDEEETEKRCEELREKLVGEMERRGKGGDARGGKGNAKGKVKGWQVHEGAEAKKVESERLRRALGLKGESKGEEGEHPMARAERRRREKEMERERDGDRQGDGDGRGDRGKDDRGK